MLAKCWLVIVKFCLEIDKPCPNALSADDAPQPPKVLTTPLEISSNLRQLQESHDPLIITFHERSQRFQSYLIKVDRDSASIALDEMIPRDGERFLLAGEPFKVEGFHEGVRIAWECNGTLNIEESDGDRFYTGELARPKWFTTSAAMPFAQR